MFGDPHVYHRPATGSRLILTVPHAGGIRYPDRPRIATASERELRVMPLARELAERIGAALISTDLHRTHADANRGIDQEPYALGFEVPHASFHMAVDHAIAQIEGPLVLLDLHGFTATDVFGDYDIILGSDEGRTVRRGTDRLLAEGLKRRGYRVAHSPDPHLGLSGRFSSGWIVRRSAAQCNRVDAVQVELHQTLRFSDARRTDLFRDLLPLLSDLTPSP